jgi:hypothetical protein
MFSKGSAMGASLDLRSAGRLATVLMLAVQLPLAVQAQQPATAPAPVPAAAPAAATFSDSELDQMLAPIALYPDSLLAQVLMASTYPADVKDAATWSKAHPDDKGEAAVKKVEAEQWDPSVKSLVAFPQVLSMMDAKPADVQRLGDAFLADPKKVMDRVQFLRKKAQEAGNLKSNEQQKVSSTTQENKQVIVIEPAQPAAVSVPVYQPSVVYGTWWWPTYPPYYWPPPAYYYPAGGFVAGVVWGAAIVGIGNALWGGCNWGGGDVNINVDRYNNINVNNKLERNQTNFQHNAERRRDVPYRDSKSQQQYGKRSEGAASREQYRGKDTRDAQRAQASSALAERGADPAAGREKLQGADRDRAAAAARDTGAANRAGGADRAGGASNFGGGAGQSISHTGSGTRDSAFSGAGDARSSAANASRGQASRASAASSRAGGGFGGGGGRGGGGRR